MLRITDMTLNCLAAYRPTPEQLKRLFSLQCALGADFIEMPVSVYEAVRPPEPRNVLLRIASPEEAARYPEITRFVCRAADVPLSDGIILEIQMNDVKELRVFGQNDAPRHMRVVGLDDILCHNYESAFQKLLSRTGVRVELCPENSCCCATAVALEWTAAGGTELAATLGGLGNKAALEEVLLALHVIRRHRPTASYDILPQLALAVEELTGVRFPDRKAVIGRNIFNVESGIHVDGILKKPRMYEPYTPELVGRTRKLIVGKHSGRKSIAAKLRELGYSPAAVDVARLLSAVRAESTGKMTSLTDAEFLELAERHRL